MKNIANEKSRKNGTLLAFVTLLRVQANAQVTVEKVTLKQELENPSESILLKLWSKVLSSDSRLGANAIPRTSKRFFSGTDIPAVLYKEANNDPSEIKQLRDNPTLTDLYHKEYQETLS